MAGWSPEMVTPSLFSAPTANSGQGTTAPDNGGAHHGLVGIVLIAVVVLFLLDRAGFRFAVTAGRG